MVRQEGPEHVSSRPNSDPSGMSAAWSLRGKADIEQGARHPRFMSMSRQIMAQRMSSLPMLAGFDRSRLSAVVDWLAVGVAVSLPWSTTATDVLVVAWLVAVLPTLDLPALRRELSTAAAYLPVLLWLLAAIGMLWADVSWAERFSGLNKFHRLLFIPLLLLHFQKSERGVWVLWFFLASTSALLLVSWASLLIPALASRENTIGVPVKEYISQSAEFVACAFGLLAFACGAARERRWRLALGSVVAALLFLADMLFVVTSRTSLLVIVALLLLLAFKAFRWKGLVTALVVSCVAAAAVWSASPYLRDRLTTSVTELKAYREKNAANPTGLHLEFLRESLTFVSTAPLFGHGTGSIPQLFRQAAFGGEGASSATWGTPHDQILGVAVQIGLIGAVLLIAMWIVHFLLFTGKGLVSLIGMLVVAQNVVSSTFDLYLFAFVPGWLYVFGVGVVGGMVLRQRDIASTKAARPPQVS
jgi:O-antigen ligase